MTFSKDDTVTWNTEQGETTGKVIEKLTSKTTFKGQTFKASADEPYYKVESEKSGSTAIHKESSLKKA